MKTLFVFAFALLGMLPVCAQTSLLGKVKIIPQDTSLVVSNSDSSYIYDALIFARQAGSLSSVTVTCRYYNAASQQWITEKDTSYACATVTITAHNNQAYKICKPGTGLLKLCLGRMSGGTRRKLTFTVLGINGVLTKEFNF